MHIETDPVVDVERVRDVERELRSELPHNLLAALLAGVDRAESVTAHLRLDAIVRLTEGARERGLPKRFLAFGRNEQGFYAALRDSAQDEDFEVWLYVPGSAPVFLKRFSTWLADAYEARRSAARSHEAPSLRALSDPHGYVPQLRTARAPVSFEREVLHPKFGIGRVVREVREGEHPKVLVDFSRFGRKLLLADSVVDAAKSA